MNKHVEKLLLTADDLSMRLVDDRAKLMLGFELLCHEGGAERGELEQFGTSTRSVGLNAVLADGRTIRIVLSTSRQVRRGQTHISDSAYLYVDGVLVPGADPKSAMTFSVALNEAFTLMKSAVDRPADNVSTEINEDPLSGEIEETEEDDTDQPIVYAGTCDRCGHLNMTSWSGRRLDGEFANGVAYDCTGYDADTDERCWADVYIMPCTEAEYEDMKAEHASQAERRLLEAA